ncbi:alpha-mannosidase [Paenibacillus hamazuiensis]|uniref:alpha-mannosidase n=1 Tax=Paenibacillus hamazuiensis TaxID=2936508 RepID=UPI00200D0ECE|nr:alpha-mannosidase [Paenibacillus hamazuiensis]
MFWTKEKLAARLKELERFRYREERTLAGMCKQVDRDGAVGAYPPEGGEWEDVQLGDRWKGRDCYVWLAAQAEIPAEWAGRKIVGRFDFGRTGGGNNSGFESLLFVNGKPYQGVDSNHEEVFFPQQAAGTTVRLHFRLWSGLNGYGPAADIEHTLQMARIGWLDEAADDLYYTAAAALETVLQLDEKRPEYHELLKALDRAFLLIDWSQPGSDDFYRTLAGARGKLREELTRLPKQHPVTVRCIGHTHIDVAWLWRLKHTREKAARSFSTVLRLMELYPDYIFLQTQPQLYDYIKTDYPEIYEQIRQRVSEGRWEAGGAMWLEADCNLTSGESLVRQILYGTRFFKNEFGTDCKYLWLPDVFGYSWALPQILKKSGIDMFMTTKISWNQYNRMPHDTFLWRGIDGSEVLTHFITTPDPGGSEGAFYYTYNGKVTPHSVQGIWDAYRDKELNQSLLLSYGYGDGGGGVNREMLEMRRRLETMPGVPKVTTGRADSYFEELQRTVAESDRYVHTWDGELYLELHRGTYTSQAYNKRANRKLELLYRETEWLSALNSVLRGDWSGHGQAELAEGWKIILRNQFHDIIPGSSIREVYEDSRLEYDEAFRLGNGVWERAASQLAGKAGEDAGPRMIEAGAEVRSVAEAEGTDAASCRGAFAAEAGKAGEHARAGGTEAVPAGSGGAVPGADAARPVRWGANEGVLPFVVFNSASWERNGLVQIDAGEGLRSGIWSDAEGNRLEAACHGGRWLVKAAGLPSMGYRTIYFTPQAGGTSSAAAVFEHGAGWLTTPHYRIEWNASGQLTSLYDKAQQREVLAEGARGNVLQVFEDKPKSRHEAWDIDLFYQEKMRTISDLRSVDVLEEGPLRLVVRFEWSYAGSTVAQNMIVYADSRRIDFETKVDWQERRQLLKVAFPVGIRSTEATYDIQFGNVKRPTHWNTSWDYARFETVGHQWADLSERGYGVSLLNDCKYGYDIKDNVMRLTLIKSAMVPDPEADRGEHTFTYALYPHRGDWLEAGTVQAAWDLNSPLRAAECGSAGPDGASEMSLFSASGGHIIIDAVKKAEDRDSVVLRLHEYAGARGSITVRSGLKIASWQETDLLERPVAEPVQEAELRFAIKPYEIKTFMIEFLK